MHGKAAEVSSDVVSLATRLHIAYQAMENQALLTAVHEYVDLLRSDLRVRKIRESVHRQSEEDLGGSRRLSPVIYFFIG